MKVRFLEIVSGLGMGGAEKSFLNRVRWAPAGIQTLIVNTRPELSVWTSPPEIPSIDCKRNDIAFLWRMAIEIRRFYPHVVTVRSPIDLIFVASIRRFTRAKWNLVYEAHSTKLSQISLVDFLLAPLMKLAISQASLTIAVSKSVAKGSQCLGAKDVQVHYFGAEVDTTLSASRKFNFLFVGRLVPLKQPLSLLKAVALLREVFRKEGASLQIVGSGPLEAEVRNFIEEQGLSSFVELVGYSNNLDSLYAESEYLISTSKFEGLPITFFEAKLHGLRVITFPSSGDFDILGVEDEVLKSFTEHELVAALKSAIQSGIASDNERHLVKERSQWMLAKHCADKYYELVENKLELSKLT